ncbi:hypothetical protein LEMLEM_LOCUS418, partial [Lemmus lemmus]
ITHGQPQDARPASSQNRRLHGWKRVKESIVNCLRHLCCCLPPAETMPLVRTRLHRRGILKAPTEPALKRSSRSSVACEPQVGDWSG